MSANITLKALGLNLQQNQLDSPSGSFTIASNVIIKRDGVVEPRRGYPLYGTSLGSTSDRAKQLMTYKERILRHFSNSLQYDTLIENANGESIFNTFCGTYLEPETGRRIRFIEANGNFYFTTSDGIKKISARTAADFTTACPFITQAGGIKALDLTARLGSTPGFLPQDSAVAYRVVWGTTDLNGNLILGAPSPRVVIYNPLSSSMTVNFNSILNALDQVSNNTGNPSLITDANYISTLRLLSTSSASELYTNLIALAAKLDNDILYASTAGGTPIMIGGAGSTISVTSNIATITQDTASTENFNDYLVSGSSINLIGFTGAAAVANGPRTVATVDNPTGTFITFPLTTGNFTQTPIAAGSKIYSYEYESITAPSAPSEPPTDAELVALQDYLSAILTRLQSEPDTGTTPVISANSQTNFVSTQEISGSRNVILHFTIPDGITTNYFYQIYRSNIARATGTQILLDDVVPDDELRLVYEAFATTTDISNGFIEVEDVTPEEFAGAFLYTDETNGEGILQSNDLPPFAMDINRFKNVIFYANTRTRHRRLISLLGVSQMIDDFNTVINSKTFTSAGVNTGTDTITIASHGFLNGQTVLFSNPTLGNLPGGIFEGRVYYIISASTNTFQISESLGGTAVNITSGGTGTHTIESHQFPTITIANGTTSNTYSFVTGVEEVTRVTTVADTAGSLAGTYFSFYSAGDNTHYVPWYKVSGTGTAPVISGATLVEVDINTGDSANTVASKTFDALSVFISDFTITVSTNILTITNIDVGICTDASAGTSGFTVLVLVQGRGEDSTHNFILLSDAVSPAQAVDATARSLVRIINSNTNEIIYAYYLSGTNDVPGKILFEARTLSSSPYYILGNSIDTGASFNPDISPAVFISSNTAANPTVVTTSSPHGLANGDQVIITNSNSTPSIDGVYTITYLSTTTFSIPVSVTVAGTQGALRNVTTAVTSDNEVLPNRIYYSKFLQPEAVPLVNTIDVGAKDKAILRIFPLRDSLFVFKEDGLFRISGESAPFNLALFDSSCILIAPDSLDVSNNLLYGWTTQGVVATSESNVSIISRPIDIEILKLATEQYTNFHSATWGIGYESDNSYTVYTVQETDDIYAQIGYRYSTLTNTWTTFDKSATCGVINSANDRQYLGAGDVHFLEQERKNFNRLDYADREIVKELQAGHYFDNQLLFPSVSDIVVGDVITQDQYVTVFQFNSLLEKLDLDIFLSPHNYLSTQEMAAGANTRIQLDALLDKIAADPGRVSQVGFLPGTDYTQYKEVLGTGTITSIAAGDPTVITTSGVHNLQDGRVITITGSDSTPSIDGTYQVTVLTTTTFTIPVSVTQPGTTGSFSTENDNFLDIQASYNGMIGTLNIDPGVAASNYKEINNVTLQEAIVTAVNNANHKITLNLILNFIVGPMTVFKAIHSTVLWSPQTFNDPLNLKHVREATMRFEDKAFTSATLSFSSDLLPAFTAVDFRGTSNGIFGYNDFGYNFFGGGSHGAPFRTYIPRPYQYCTYLNCKFSHMIAREKYSIFGLTLKGENLGENSRGYR